MDVGEGDELNEVTPHENLLYFDFALGLQILKTN